jgi:hypothetical protein
LLNESGSPPIYQRAFGLLMVLVGASVFAIRLQHAGPYAFPRGGNLLSALLALVIGVMLIRLWFGARRLAKSLGWLTLAASPIVLFFALYATLAELEEVVALKVTNQSGQPAVLRLWIVDRDDGQWVTMPRSKADTHGLYSTRAELLRHGETRCVIAILIENRETANEIHSLRQEKYSVQRLATSIGLFGREVGHDTVTLRLDPCPMPDGQP